MAILWALMLEIGTSVTTADVHLEVLVDDLLHRQAEEVELPIIMVEDVRGPGVRIGEGSVESNGQYLPEYTVSTEADDARLLPQSPRKTW